MALTWIDYALPLAQAVVAGIVVALSILGIGFKFNGTLSSIDNSVGNISNSVGFLEDRIREVDLKEIEKTVAKLEWQLDSGSGGSDNSVRYKLDNSDITVTVSLQPGRGGNPSHIQGNIQKYIEANNEEVDSPDDRTLASDIDHAQTTVIKLEFDDRINSRYVTEAIRHDQDLIDYELDLFEGVEPDFYATSPMEMVFRIPTTDYDEISEWLPELLDRLDRYHMEYERETTEFDEAIAKNLQDSEIV